MKLILILLFPTSVFCQSVITQSYFSATIYSSNLEGLPEMVDAKLVITSEIKVLKQNQLMLCILTNQSATMAGAPLDMDKDPDSILFDIANKKVYIFKEKASYNFIRRKHIFKIAGNDLESRVKDTVITLDKKLDSNITPFPTLGNIPYGVKRYALKKFEILYEESKQIKGSLMPLYNRVRNFRFDPKPLPLQF
jgi:hypothetical protein